MLQFLLLVILVVPSYQLCQICEDCSRTPIQDSSLCNCDADCVIFGDCCGSLSPPDSCPPPSLNPLLPGVVLECQSIYLNASINENEGFLMVSSCPTCIEAAQEGSGFCTNKEILLPPVTDLKTGIVYRNEYCAYCNGVEELVTWQIDLVCRDNVHKAILQSNLSTLVDNDPMIFQRECKDWSYRLPSLPPGTSLPRSCIPTINFCLPKSNLEFIIGNISSLKYSEMEKNCSSILDLIEGTNGLNYKNPSCAICNAVQVKQCSTINKTNNHTFYSHANEVDLASATERNISFITVAISTSSTISVYSGQDTTLLVNVSCTEGNPLVAFRCHHMPCSFFYPHGKKYCPDFMEVLSQCYNILVNCSSMKYIFNSTQNISLYNPLGFSLSCADTASCPDGFKLLNKSESTNFYNGNILYNNEILDKWYYDAQFQVFICTESEGDLIALICHYVAHSVSLIGVLLIALTYSLFKEARNLPSTIIMNYAIPTLLNSVLHLFTEQKHIITNQTVNVSFAIVLHYLQLVQLTWIVTFSYEVLRKFYLGLHLKQDSKKSQRKHLIAYLCAGWCPALLLVSITVVINFTTHDLVQYGLSNRGIYMLHFNSFLVAEGLYAFLCITFSIISFIIITFLICSQAKAKFKLRQKGMLLLFRLWIVVVSLSCFTYVPYFINNPKWLVYVVDYYNETRGIFIFLALFLNKKVFNLYRNFFSCTCSCSTTDRHEEISIRSITNSPIFIHKTTTTSV